MFYSFAAGAASKSLRRLNTTKPKNHCPKVMPQARAIQFFFRISITMSIFPFSTIIFASHSQQPTHRVHGEDGYRQGEIHGGNDGSRNDDTGEVHSKLSRQPQADGRKKQGSG
jgi:hypothetical protein